MMLDLIITLAICSLLSGAVIIMWACAWDMFEDTELWEIIKDKMTRKDE